MADIIRETESRLVENVKVQEGDSPVEDPTTAVILDLLIQSAGWNTELITED